MQLLKRFKKIRPGDGAVAGYLSLIEHARPARAGASQTRAGNAASAASATLTTWSRRVCDRDFALAAADQTRDDVAHGDSSLSRPRAPGTRLLCVNSLWLAHLSLPIERRSGRDGKQDVCQAMTHSCA